MKQKTSTIALHHEALREHLNKALQLGASQSASCESFAKKYQLHGPSVLCYARANGLLPQIGESARKIPDLKAHLEAGRSQLEFSRENGMHVSVVCRMAKSLGWGVQLISSDEWKLIQQLRRGRMAE